jgi:hypothetical protein
MPPPCTSIAVLVAKGRVEEPAKVEAEEENVYVVIDEDDQDSSSASQ